MSHKMRTVAKRFPRQWVSSQRLEVHGAGERAPVRAPGFSLSTDAECATFRDTAIKRTQACEL
jgi:hypothetical protein